MIFGRHIYKVKTVCHMQEWLFSCNCISITFWSGDLPSPLMAIFKANFLFYLISDFGSKEKSRFCKIRTMGCSSER